MQNTTEQAKLCIPAGGIPETGKMWAAFADLTCRNGASHCQIVKKGATELCCPPGGFPPVGGTKTWSTLCFILDY